MSGSGGGMSTGPESTKPRRAAGAGELQVRQTPPVVGGHKSVALSARRRLYGRGGAAYSIAGPASRIVGQGRRRPWQAAAQTIPNPPLRGGRAVKLRAASPQLCPLRARLCSAREEDPS